MNAHSLKCPKCSAVLKSAKPIPSGVKVKCPKCQHAFVSPQPEDDELVEPEIEEATAIQSGQMLKQTAMDRDTNLDNDSPPSRGGKKAAADDDVDDLDELDELDELDDAEDEDEDRPRKRRRPRDDDDDDEDDEPRARKKKRARDDDEDDVEEDDDDRPRKKKPKKKKKAKSNAGLFIGLAAGGGALVLVGIVVAVFLVLNAGGTARHEAAAREMFGHLDELAGILETVKDRNSAQAAAPRIRDVASRLQQAAERAKALPNLTPQQDTELQNKLQPELTKTMSRMQSAAMSAGFASGGEPAFVAALQDLEKVGRAMSTIGRR